MSLTPGTRLGPFEIAALIGVGGMGEVYRATDTSLKRQVAIKVLPQSVSGVPDRLGRFQREAEALASLNHQNIAQIYGLEKSDGAISLVMELVDGPTLADRIAQGAVAVDEALLVSERADAGVHRRSSRRAAGLPARPRLGRGEAARWHTRRSGLCVLA